MTAARTCLCTSPPSSNQDCAICTKARKLPLKSLPIKEPGSLRQGICAQPEPSELPAIAPAGMLGLCCFDKPCERVGASGVLSPVILARSQNRERIGSGPESGYIDLSRTERRKRGSLSA